MTKIGDRVGVVLRATPTEVFLLGYGTFLGHEVPPKGMLHDHGIPNPKIQLDNGKVVWGYQVWWGPAKYVAEMIGKRAIKQVDVDTLEGEIENGRQD